MKRLLGAGLAGGVVLFVWAFLVHVVLGWYDAAWQGFTDEAAVTETLEANAQRGGLYYLPLPPDMDGPPRTEALVHLIPAGEKRGMGLMMVTGLGINIVSVWLVLLVLQRRNHSPYRDRVGQFALAGLLLGFVGNAYYWNWFGFPAVYFGLSLADAVIAWTLAGAVVAAIEPKRRR